MAGVDHESDERDPIALARRNWEDAGWGTEVADGMEAVTSVMRAHQIMLARVEQELKPFGLTFSRFELLRLLAFSRHGSLPISKASDRLQVHVSSATHAIARLVDAGLVERNPHPTDGRTTLVSITDDGRELVEKATAVLNANVFGRVGMSATSAHQLVAAIRELRSASGDF
ncbi:MarR family transcriptional regulator [Gordonia hydrophobica]|uniref:MarR family transcriptional regulator n=1 Tax=Gordonia hydrophobica TaxID=40516 RepID=A0ABZ2TXM3_9ACTN|nr:MarR family transcriptional regulator [Gordonia hydrophobica]MBM7366421.1 DNA-binding MarR family transcriptional regulator [Gordonia hydrophobica]